MSDTGLVRRLLKGVFILAMVGAVALAALLAALWVERRLDVTLPAPTGSLAVGRINDVWTDDTVDALAPVQGAKRELLVWMWYPAAATPIAPANDYVPAPMRIAAGPPRGPMSLVTRDASKVQVHSTRGPDLSPQARSYPIVILRGGASAGVVGYSTFAEDLASHGYVVVGFDAPYRTNVVVFPDGRVMRRTPQNNPELCGEQELARQESCVSKILTAWTNDTAFALDRLQRLNSGSPSSKFAGRLDLTHVGVFGHSLGGATAAQFCHDDSRCTAAIDVDGQPFGTVVQSGLRQPFMFLLSDHGKASDPVSRHIEANIQSIYDRLPRDSRLRVAIRGGYHFGFSDDGAVLKSQIILRTLRTLRLVGIDGRRQLVVAAYCIRSFFDAHLKGAGGAVLGRPSPLYPEIEVLD